MKDNVFFCVDLVKLMINVLLSYHSYINNFISLLQK